MELIPAIDIIGGKCVRLAQGAYEQKTVYSDNPLEIAQAFEDMGIRRLHLVDLDGARAGQVVNLDILEAISGQTGLIIDFGGGVKSDEDLRKVFEAGAAMLTAGSLAVSNKSTVEGWLKEYGPERIILGADVRNNRIAVNAWQKDTHVDVYEFIGEYEKAGIRKVICTDISRDGMLTGPSLKLYRGLRRQFPDLELIASGGISGMQDIPELEKAGVKGVIFGKAFYEGRISSQEIREYLSKKMK
jgi:phosphoribosylformimino-5-aminoimidazole carboxamide ribotide isomerase